MTQRDVERYVVRVPEGIPAKVAVEEHRNRTGHGGCVFLVSEPPVAGEPKRAA